jgi:ATP-dependent Clp protease ATP-binding subunit ClpA
VIDRLTERTRIVIQLAWQEAQRRGRSEVGTDDLLVGLLKEGTGIAADLLRRVGLDLRTIRSAGELAVAGGDAEAYRRPSHWPNLAADLRYAPGPKPAPEPGREYVGEAAGLRLFFLDPPPADVPHVLPAPPP